MCTQRNSVNNENLEMERAAYTAYVYLNKQLVVENQELLRRYRNLLLNKQTEVKYLEKLLAAGTLKFVLCQRATYMSCLVSLFFTRVSFAYAKSVEFGLLLSLIMLMGCLLFFNLRVSGKWTFYFKKKEVAKRVLKLVGEIYEMELSPLKEQEGEDVKPHK